MRSAPLPHSLMARVGIVAVALLSASCTGYLVVKDGEVNPRAMRRVEKRTADVRGLPFKGPVDAEVYSKKKSAQFFTENLDDGPSEKARVDDLIAHRLGVLPDGQSLSELFAQALSQNAAGVYVPPSPSADPAPEATAAPKKRGRLFIVPDALPAPVRVPLRGVSYLTGTDWANELYLSHELVHALQDQHWDLAATVPGSLYRENEDQALARKAIIESEANLVSQAYLVGADLDSVVQRNLLIEYLALGKGLDVAFTRWMTPDLPPFYVKLFVEQYTEGMRFLQAATNRDGWRAVNNAYRVALPESTEQLMWPEKFFGPDFDRPKTLPPMTFPAATLTEARRVESNVFGALLFRIFLEDYVSSSQADDVVEGWGGDRYDIFDLGEQSALVFRTVWDSEADAKEAVRAYRAVLDGKYPDRLRKLAAADVPGLDELAPDAAHLFRVAPKETGEDTPGVRTTVVEDAAIVRFKERVLILEGAPEGGLAALINALVPQLAPLERDDADENPSEALKALEVAADDDTDEFIREPPRRLRDRLFLPHHQIAFRAGLGLTLRSPSAGDLALGLDLDREVRWGFREHLEWTPPFIFSLRLPAGTASSTILTGGFHHIGLTTDLQGGLALYALPTAQLTQALHLGRAVTVVGQGGVDGDVATSDRGASPWTMFGSLGVMGQIFDRVIIAGGARVNLGWDGARLFSGHPGLPAQTISLGAVTRRGGAALQPSVELRVFDELYVYESSVVTLLPSSFRLVRQTHLMGAILYF